ncbi:hypothetical protein DFJ43DRAFT_1173215 [Lentinula guzmanii]|uniref:Uncharacterized protein n=1 Tax=Lentinula guzmanii TaxID=2804957 RepID=A0AA38J155_9AGAR|nr:hypothetical protein DFJ43DRAFT_1173215 [Lentinula guzmanii]
MYLRGSCSHKERREQPLIDSEGIVYEKTKSKPTLRVKVPPNPDSNPSVSSTSTSLTLSTAIDSPATVTSPTSATINITHGIFAISDSPPIPLILTTPSNTSHPSEVNEDKNSPRRKDKGNARASGVLLLNGDIEAESEVKSESGEEENDGGGEVEREDGDASSGNVWDGEVEAGVRWVAEEGEVFREGNVLLGPEEMEGEYDGEELRRELLEATVERPAPRSLHIDDPDEYGSILTPSPLSPTSTPISSTPLSAPLTPMIPPPASSLTPSSSLSAPPTTPLVSLPEHVVVTAHSGTTPTQDYSFTFRETPSLTSLSAVVELPAVRPYIPRTRSTSSTTANAVQNTSG